MKKKILLVEDDLILVDLYEATLEMEGFQVLKATSGKEGLKILKKDTPDLILLDILMPEMNGFEFLKELKKIKTVKNVPVLLLTNLGESKLDINRELAFALGIEGYLIKSKNPPEQVVSRIKNVLETVGSL
ncbi:MAG: response regulator [Patescibacteria group bacterium]|nr:response regulator [Patescibacteria group bacterium]